MTKAPGTYDDANLILTLYDLRREPRLREGRKWMAAQPPFTSREDFLKRCPAGSEENASFRMVTTYWDMAASFIVNGVLHAELFFRSNNGELLYVWERIRRMVPEMRAAGKNPLSYKNLEDVANAFIKFYAEQAPGYYENLVSIVEKTPLPAK